MARNSPLQGNQHRARKGIPRESDDSAVGIRATRARVADLWTVEAQVKGSNPQTRLDAQRHASAPIVDELIALWKSELTQISGKSKIAEAIRYSLSRKTEFRRFLKDRRVELDNNTVERAICPITITRKNVLFAGSEAGGSTWATIASPLATARLNEVDPNARLTQTLKRIAAGWPNKDIHASLPQNVTRS